MKMSGKSVEFNNNDDCVFVSKKYLDNLLKSAIFKGDKVDFDSEDNIEAFTVVDNFRDSTGFVLIKEQDLRNLLNTCKEHSTEDETIREMNEKVDYFYDEKNFYRDMIYRLLDGDAATRERCLVDLFKHEKESSDRLARDYSVLSIGLDELFNEIKNLCK